MSHRVVSHDEWVAARSEFLKAEKEFTRQRDEINRRRRELPWEKVEKEYIFEGPNGPESLGDLFDGRSQLVVYHFMFGPDWDAGCPHCSFWADNFNDIIIHLNHRDTSMVAVSRAPFAKIDAYRKRMGWSFKWLSSGGNDFNFDYGVSFKPEDQKKSVFNYGTIVPGGAEREGVSVFRKEGGDIFHTYSAYARGIDMMNTAYHIIDMTSKGRDEGDRPQFWVRRHDEYART
jgi:predicted dithiol-disulfide oxidoreductase (DUF899 family)